MNNRYETIKIILADDHEIFRDGFRALLKKNKKIELIGEASDGKELIEITSKLKPDVVITDIKMPVIDGIVATSEIISANPEIGVIALSNFDDDEQIVDILRAGATGYLIKNAAKEEIIDAIKAVANKEPYYCTLTSLKLANLIATSNHNPFAKEEKVSFTDNEKCIIKLICKGYVNKEIGDELDLSKRTIDNYREKIIEKTNTKNTAGLIIYAIKNKFFNIDE